MELARSQALLARLATDAEFRREYFRENPCLPEAPVEAFAKTLLRKRLGAVRQLLPQSSRAWGDRFGALFLQHAGTHLTPLDDARRFAAVLSGLPDPESAVSRRELRKLRVHSRLFAAQDLFGKATQFVRDLIPRSPERR